MANAAYPPSDLTAHHYLSRRETTVKSQQYAYEAFLCEWFKAARDELLEFREGVASCDIDVESVSSIIQGFSVERNLPMTNSIPGRAAIISTAGLATIPLPSIRMRFKRPPFDSLAGAACSGETAGSSAVGALALESVAAVSPSPV